MNYTDALKILENYYPDKGASALMPGCRDPKLSDLSLPVNKNKKRDVDVIIPVYNADKFIGDCVKSVLKQKTGFSFHVFVINDGSTDKTPQILKKFEGLKQVTVIHQKNSGVSVARNRGLAESDSRYIMFVDSDDMLAPNAIEKLVGAAKEHKAQIVTGSYYNFRKLALPIRVYKQKKMVIHSLDDFTSGHCWAKVFDSRIFQKVHFPTAYWFEDSVMQHLFYPLSMKTIGIPDIVYQRRYNKDSITHISIGNVKSIDSVWVTLRLLKDRREIGLPFDRDYYNYITYMNKLTQVRVEQLPKEVQTAAAVVFEQLIRTEFAAYPESEVN